MTPLTKQEIKIISEEYWQAINGNNLAEKQLLLDVIIMLNNQIREVMNQFDDLQAINYQILKDTGKFHQTSN